MIAILTWISIIAGAILILMLFLSLIGGLDLDVDMDYGSSDVDAGGGGLGLFKGLLTFISVSSWVVKVLVAADKHIGVAIIIGILSGLIAFGILNFMIVLILKNQSNVNWAPQDTLYKSGSVYLKIPADKGNGLIHVNVNGAIRELKAKSFDQVELKTGDDIYVVQIDGEYAIVQKVEK